MSQPPYTQHLTEIQTLSLLPDSKIGSWSSETRKALQAGLRATASHPKCHGIYWLKNTEDPQKVVVISKWAEVVDLATSRSYLRPLLPHLESPPVRSIHVNHALHSFSSYTISNFLTAYFPIRKCTAYFKNQIVGNVAAFTHATEHTYNDPESLRFVASGWIKETKILDGEVASGFMFCLMWTDRKSEEQYKKENEHWRVLMRYLKAMGMLGEEQFHGKAFQVLGQSSKERFEFSDDSSDEDEDDKMDKQLELMRERLRKLAPSCGNEVRAADNISCREPGEPMPEVTSSEATRHWNRQFFGSPKCSDRATSESPRSVLWWEHDAKKSAVEGSDDESPDSTPLLTPSSSTMSLSSLFGNSKSMSELPGIWKSDYDISRAQVHMTNDTSVSNPCSVLDEDESSQQILPNGNYQYEFSSDNGHGEAGTGMANREELVARLEIWARQGSIAPPQETSPVDERLQGILSLESPRISSTVEDEKAIPGLMRRYGVAKWDPEEELQNAKSRFWRRRQRLVTPRLETQRATLRGRSPPGERISPIEPVLTIDPLRDSDSGEKRKSSWWGYLRECLPSPAAGSVTSSDVEAGADVAFTPGDAIVPTDDTVSGSGSHANICTLGTHDNPLSVTQMEEAKARLARIG